MGAEAYYRALKLRAIEPEEERAIAERFSPDQPHGVGGTFAASAKPGEPAHVAGVHHGHRPAGAPGGPGGPKEQPKSPDPATTNASASQPLQLPPGLSKTQQSAVQAWLGPDHDAIAAEARGKTPGPWAKAIAEIEAAIAAATPTPEDQTVYRGLPPDLQGLAAHAMLHFPGFLSTSTQPLPAGIVAMEITVPEGVHALQLPGELLLGRGGHLRVDALVPGGAVKMTLVGAPATPEEKQLRALASRLGTQFNFKRSAVIKAISILATETGYERAGNEARALLALVEKDPEVTPRQLRIEIRTQPLRNLAQALSALTGQPPSARELEARSDSRRSAISAWLKIPITERMEREAYLRQQGVDVEALSPRT